MNKKEITKNTLICIGMACTIFCIIGVIFDQIYKGTFTLENYSFTKMVLGSVGIGLGFGIPSTVYEKDNLSPVMQTLIHMGTGCIVMSVIAFVVGWVPVQAGIGAVIVTILGELALAFMIWGIYYLHMKKVAKELNEKLMQK